MWRDHDEKTELDPRGPGTAQALPAGLSVQRFRLTCTEGANEGASWISKGQRFAIGSHRSNDVVLEDRTVSRFHCEIALDESGVRVVDLESRNGTLVDGVRIERAWLRDGSELRLGHSALTFRLDAERAPVRLWPSDRFGTMVGRSAAIRATFAEMSAAASSDVTVLLEGETGTGKEEAAQSIHDASARRDGPLVIVDCGAIPGALLESELFGHERGAFTNAVTSRQGAFDAADGGTIFLDEIGELPLELQPKVLRAIERRTVRPVGQATSHPVDVRVVAATNRNLRREVNEGRFRSDLYYRLAVFKITLPPLRRRPEDLPLLVEHFMERLRVPPEVAERVITPDAIAAMQRAAWPGNVRQLRNHLERCIVLDSIEPLAEAPRQPGPERHAVEVDPNLSYAESRRLALDTFERRYVEALLDLHRGNMAAAARAAGIDRTYLYRLASRHGLRR